MTITAAQIESYRRSWFPPGANTQERAELFWRALGRPSLTASQGDERAELFRRVLGHRPTEFRSRTDPYQAQIGRALDGVLSRRTTDARRELAAALGRADHRRRMEAARALGRRQGLALARREHSAALLAALDRRTEAALERKRRLVPQGPIRLI